MGKGGISEYRTSAAQRINTPLVDIAVFAHNAVAVCVRGVLFLSQGAGFWYQRVWPLAASLLSSYQLAQAILQYPLQ